MWHNDRSGYLEPPACNYHNYLTRFLEVLISSLYILFLGVLFLALQVEDLRVKSNFEARSKPWRVRFGLRISSCKGIYFRCGKKFVWFSSGKSEAGRFKFF